MVRIPFRWPRGVATQATRTDLTSMAAEVILMGGPGTSVNKKQQQHLVRLEKSFILTINTAPHGQSQSGA